MDKEQIGICADIDALVEHYESRMTRERAKKILTAWYAKSDSPYVDQDWPFDNNIKLDGDFTVDELEAFVWCKRNEVQIYDLAREE